MLTFKYRIYPSRVQRRRLDNALRLCMELHNHLLQYCIDQREKAKETGTKFHPTSYAMCSEITRFKKEHPEYNAVWMHILQGVSKRLGEAYSSFFRRVKERKVGEKPGFPHFKKCVRSLYFQDAHGYGYGLESGSILRVSKIGRIPIKLDRAPKGNIKTLTILKDGDRWFALLTTDSVKSMDIAKKDRTPIGIDLGIDNLVALSDGNKIENPRFYGHALKRIKMLQRRMDKKKEGSQNWRKAKIKFWKAHQRVEDLRADFIHKTTTDLLRNHNIIAIENLTIPNMVRNHHLAGSIWDAGWGRFRNYLIYKAAACGVQVIPVNSINTSQTCSRCGQVLEKKIRLPKRIFKCPSCGLVEDRDINAAKVILARGLQRFAAANFASSAGEATLGQRECEARGEAVSISRPQVAGHAGSMKQELHGGAETKSPSGTQQPSVVGGGQEAHKVSEERNKVIKRAGFRGGAHFGSRRLRGAVRRMRYFHQKTRKMEVD